MSLGIFRSIRGSYAPEYRRQADKMICQLNAELMARGLPEYRDPAPDEQGLRQLPCGNAGASTFYRLQKLAEEAGLRWTLGRLRGERQVALPFEFRGTFSVRLGRTFLFIPFMQEFASVHAIHEELIALAPILKIPLKEGTLSDAMGERLADCLGVADNEPAGLLENERGLWVDLYYATRYGMEDSTPLVIG